MLNVVRHSLSLIWIFEEVNALVASIGVSSPLSVRIVTVLAALLTPLSCLSSVVRELGTSFTDEKLAAKPSKKGVISKQKGKKPETPEDGLEDGSKEGGSKAKKSKK